MFIKESCIILYASFSAVTINLSLRESLYVGTCQKQHNYEYGSCFSTAAKCDSNICESATYWISNVARCS